MNKLDYFYLKALNSMALSVESVLEDGKEAMESGGAFAEQSGVIDKVFGGAYHLTYKAAFYLVMIGFIVFGVGLFFASTQERSEKKKQLLWGAGAAIIVGCAGSIIAFVVDFGKGVFSGL